MAPGAVCKTTREQLGLSVVQQNGVRHVFATAVPRCGGSLREQLGDALENLAARLRREGALGTIVHQAVFVADPSRIDDCRVMVRDFHGRDVPVTSYLPQPPCGGPLVAIEAQAFGTEGAAVAVERVSEHVVIARHDGLAWIFCAPEAPSPGVAGAYTDTLRALEAVRVLLHDVGVPFDQVIRTWLHLGGIVAHDGPAQRYQEMNRARDDFYRGIAFATDRAREERGAAAFPASTGIGTEGRSVRISALALASEWHDVRAVPLENPRQTPAYDYATRYTPRSPKFSRAMVLSRGAGATIFISGTASITNSESRHVGDVVGQTHETLDNITALISKQNLTRHGLPGYGTSLENLAVARVYVKRQADYPVVRAVVEERLGVAAPPTTYVVADVCRPELLVEIEGIAFAPAGPERPRRIPHRPHLRNPVVPSRAPAPAIRPRRRTGPVNS
jgi:enamine deaminase RidA (YjgF/YER057c/UK114 family)